MIMLAKNCLLAIFSLLVIRGFADGPQAETFLNDGSCSTASGQTCIAAGLLWGKDAFESSKTVATAPTNSDGDFSQQPPPAQRSSRKTNDYRSILELKGGYFFFTDSKMRKVYDKGGVDLQLSGSYPIWKWIQIYGSVEYLARQRGRISSAATKEQIYGKFL